MPLTADVGTFVLWMIQTAVPLVMVASLVLAFRRRPDATRREAALGRAQWLTVAVTVVVAYLVAVAVLRYVQRSPFGVIVFLTVCGAAVGGGLVLRWAWRAHARAVKDELPRDVAPPPRPHEGLSGDREPPTRW